MTHKEVFDMLKTLNIPVAYDHFESNKNVQPPFVAYREISPETFKADGITYYRPYEFEIELAERKRNLPSSDYNYLTLYAINKGVGGDDSWGARVHKKYLVKNKKYRLTYAIKIKE